MSGAPQETDRRTFLSRLSLALGAAIGLVVTLPLVGFVLGPLRRKVPRVWRPVGPLDGFRVGETVLVELEDPSPKPWAGRTARTGAWLRRVDESELIAFSINCRHLGCPVRWVDGAELFLCPCHGGAYYSDGTVAAGPPPAALARYAVRVRQGQVEIESAPIPLPEDA